MHEKLGKSHCLVVPQFPQSKIKTNVLVDSRSVVLRLECMSDSPGGFIKAQVVGCTLKVSESAGLG